MSTPTDPGGIWYQLIVYSVNPEKPVQLHCTYHTWSTNPWPKSTTSIDQKILSIPVKTKNKFNILFSQWIIFFEWLQKQTFLKFTSLKKMQNVYVTQQCSNISQRHLCCRWKLICKLRIFSPHSSKFFFNVWDIIKGTNEC